MGGAFGPDGLSKKWILSFIPNHMAAASYYAKFFIEPTSDGKIWVVS